MTQSLPTLANEGLDAVWTISSEQEAEAAQISRVAPALSSYGKPAGYTPSVRMTGLS